MLPALLNVNVSTPLCMQLALRSSSAMRAAERNDGPANARCGVWRGCPGRGAPGSFGGSRSAMVR